MKITARVITRERSFSALQRAEIAEMSSRTFGREVMLCFSALQRAEIAEIRSNEAAVIGVDWVSVLFNEPKLLKCRRCRSRSHAGGAFQCSSTSRNC